MGKQKITGRPPTFKTPEEMQVKIDRYFEEIEGHPLLDNDGKVMQDKWGYPVYVDRHPPTITGLALALGFNTRKSLLDYCGKPAFVNTIERAKARVERYAEERLYDREGQRGAEFSLKYNFRWDAPKEEAGETGGSGGGIIEMPAVLPEEAPNG